MRKGGFPVKDFLKYRLGLGNHTLTGQFLKAEQMDSVFDVPSTSSPSKRQVHND